MVVFELVIALLLVGAVLSAVARRVNAPYPALLALAGAALVSSLGSWKGLGGTACAFPYLLASRPAKVRSREEAGQ